LLLRDCELFYETNGEGETLVLIPGFASGAWTWFEQVPELSKQFRVVTFDPRGIARSKANHNQSANMNMQDFAEDVAQLLDCLKVESAHILGASFGGFVAQEFAIHFSERLDKLILACTSFGGKNHVAPDLEVSMAFTSTQGLNSSERIRKFMIPAFTPEFAVENSQIVEKVCSLREQNIVPENIYFGQLQAATTFDAEDRVSEIKNETLVLTGGADVVVPSQNSVNLAEKMPNAILKIIQNGSHMFFIENSREFNRAVIDFIKS
jgi:pimeloyl-ACP methyl ester carboxylesterase